ncbi:MAG TPA: ABC transporter substrate-binding protein [Thermoleophilia bacterium]|nr:ABC transporter substrate-binding protein [Thermoleophilia bacterium]
MGHRDRQRSAPGARFITFFVFAGLVVTTLLRGPTLVAAPASELVVVQGLDPDTLDPHNTVQASLNVSTLIAEPLLAVSYEKGVSLDPVLATSWRVRGAKIWQFQLREGVRFTNNEEFTAETVKWNIERINDPAERKTLRAYTQVIERVEPVGKYTVNFITREAFPSFPIYLSRIPMLPHLWAQKNPSLIARSPVGTGPYRFVEWVRDERVVLASNPNYWGEKPRISRVVFIPLPDAAARSAALRSGRADIVTNLSVSDALSLQSGGQPGVSAVTVPSLRVIYVTLDQIHEGTPTQNLKLRQAMNYAVDKEGIIRTVLRGFGIKLEGQPITSQYGIGFNPSVKAYPYDPARARQLIEESGLKDVRLTFYSPVGRYLMDKEIAEVVAAQLQAVGLKIDLRVQEWGVFLGGWRTKKVSPMALIGIATFPESTAMLAVHTTDNPQSWYANPAYDVLIESATWEFDERKRQSYLQRAAETLNKDAVVLYLHQQVDLYGVSSRVAGWKPRPDEKIDLTGMRLR